jgi:hypothetical protein
MVDWVAELVGGRGRWWVLVILVAVCAGIVVGLSQG